MQATTKNFFAQQMRAYVASGVTSVLDAAAPPSVIKIVSDYSDSGAPGPTVYYLTRFVTPKDGYFSTLKFYSEGKGALCSPDSVHAALLQD